MLTIKIVDASGKEYMIKSYKSETYLLNAILNSKDTGQFFIKDDASGYSYSVPTATCVIRYKDQ